VDTLEGLLEVSADRMHYIIHNVTYVRPNGIVSNVSKHSQYRQLLFELQCFDAFDWTTGRTCGL